MVEDIILVGYGGHAKSIADSIERGGKYNIKGYTDITQQKSKYKYLGTDDVLLKYLKDGFKNVIICVGYLGKGDIRQRLYEKLKSQGFCFPTIIDPSAIISSTAVIGEGSFVGKMAVINSDAVIGKMCIINTGAIVEHECVISNYAHIAVGAVICGQVFVGDAAFIGANSTVIQCQKIDTKQLIPAGTIVR